MPNLIKIRRYQGNSLLEVLISLVVLATGLLGLAGMQATALRFNHDSYLRSIAISQANAMADRMRGNQLGVDAGHYNNLSGTPSMPTCSVCTPADIAQRDLHEWNTTNALLLPAGQGTVSVNGTVFTITVRWDNDRTGATGTGCSGNSSVDLSCVRMSTQL